MSKKISFELPLRTVSEANSTESWYLKAERHRMQQFFIREAYKKFVQNITLPCTITLTRLACRIMDDDNLVISFKYIRDELAECIFPEKRSVYLNKAGKTVKIKGRADSDERVKWKYAQEKNSSYGIRVEIQEDNEI